VGGVGIELWVVLIEFGVVFIGGWGYLTLVKDALTDVGDGG